MSIATFFATCLLLLSSATLSGAINVIDLGAAADYAILAGSTVTSTGAIGTVITGDIGVYPGTAVTGFPPAVHNGVKQLGNGESLTAQSDLLIAYNKAASLPFDITLSNVGKNPTMLTTSHRRCLILLSVLAL